jgi:hypothetical protein
MHLYIKSLQLKCPSLHIPCIVIQCQFVCVCVCVFNKIKKWLIFLSIKFCGFESFVASHTHTHIHIYIHSFGLNLQEKKWKFPILFSQFFSLSSSKKNQNQRIVDPGYFKNLQELLISMKKLVKNQSFCSWLNII